MPDIFVNVDNPKWPMLTEIYNVWVRYLPNDELVGVGIVAKTYDDRLTRWTTRKEAKELLAFVKTIVDAHPDDYVCIKEKNVYDSVLHHQVREYRIAQKRVLVDVQDVFGKFLKP